MQNQATQVTVQQWLYAAYKKLDTLYFSGNDIKMPEKVQVFPSIAGKRTAIGMHLPGNYSNDLETTTILVCPSLVDPMQIIATLLHEMIHAATPGDGHGSKFKKIARKIGLAGKLTATYCEPESELWDQLSSVLDELAAELGPLNLCGFSLKNRKSAGKPLNPIAEPEGSNTDTGEKSESRSDSDSSWVRMVCTENDSYKVLVSPKSLKEHGAPKSPTGHSMLPVKQSDQVYFGLHPEAAKLSDPTVENGENHEQN